MALRYELTDRLALRGAVSNGFRAPSLHQVWFNNVSTQFVRDEDTGELVPNQVLTAHNRSPVAKAFGIPLLEEETSVNLSTGFTARLLRNLSFTADYYSIAIDDRIVLTSRFSNSNATYAALLEPFRDLGVSRAQFFTNAVDTRTQGVDLVASYAIGLGSGLLDLSGAQTSPKPKSTGSTFPRNSSAPSRNPRAESPTPRSVRTSPLPCSTGRRGTALRTPCRRPNLASRDATVRAGSAHWVGPRTTVQSSTSPSTWLMTRPSELRRCWM